MKLKREYILIKLAIKIGLPIAHQTERFDESVSVCNYSFY